MSEAEAFVTAEKIAEHLGMSTDFIWDAVKKYGMPCYRFGRAVRFKLTEVQAWCMERKKVG